MMLAQRSRRTAVILAWLGVLAPVSGFHKFYLGQPVWGTLYLLLSWTPIPRVACAVEGFLLLAQPSDAFAPLETSPSRAKEGLDPAQVSALGTALRELDTLRQDGLISELEFEQKRRQLLDRVA
ncbi:NINE protein [Leptolyngbya sp. CCNP1308]|uniref:NINE protein n=1 Tax=Leptolyngbya sp. CCNP1308 TaxID=3110255 RepID=UPI002B1E92B6|nr:NINE protein [Leptolyngbya sp. CCNP1308]MEA5447695.1 NINE protein [Leptolyngbya sp. CCNP1308]